MKHQLLELLLWHSFIYAVVPLIYLVQVTMNMRCQCTTVKNTPVPQNTTTRRFQWNQCLVSSLIKSLHIISMPSIRADDHLSSFLLRYSVRRNVSAECQPPSPRPKPSGVDYTRLYATSSYTRMSGFYCVCVYCSTYLQINYGSKLKLWQRTLTL